MTPKFYFFVILLLTAVVLILVYLVYMYLQQQNGVTLPQLMYKEVSKDPQTRPIKTILWYNPPYYVTSRIFNNDVFQNCSFNNCRLTQNKNMTSTSSAVIFDRVHYKSSLFPSPRPAGQVWVMWQHEAPFHYQTVEASNDQPGYDGFNWTMSYRSHADIKLPYGKLIKHPKTFKRNYTSIARRKVKDALWIVSHCTTKSEREVYVKELQKYISIDILGRCGKRWPCGKVYKHDSCFDIMNDTYKFYLAFENSICDHYYTEKFFENYKYDIIQVVRGGQTETHSLPRDSHIYTGAFTSVRDLAMYLKDVSKDVNKYAQLLREKDRYKSVEYQQLYSSAFCELCERLHNVEQYQSTYFNIVLWLKNKSECSDPPRDLPSRR